MTGPAFLNSRGWKRANAPNGWRKRGWCLGQEHAEILENWMEQRNGAVTPRDKISKEELAEFWLYLHPGRGKRPPFRKLETLDWANIIKLADSRLGKAIVSVEKL